MTAKEWRNHTDERIAALFTALELTNERIDKTNAQLSASIEQTNRMIKENSVNTAEQIHDLLEAQRKVIDKVDSWLAGLQSHNGKQ